MLSAVNNVVAAICVCVDLHLNTLLVPSSSELPYGWEEIDDPQYGTYYVE